MNISNRSFFIDHFAHLANGRLDGSEVILPCEFRGAKVFVKCSSEPSAPCYEMHTATAECGLDRFLQPILNNERASLLGEHHNLACRAARLTLDNQLDFQTDQE